MMKKREKTINAFVALCLSLPMYAQLNNPDGAIQGSPIPAVSHAGNNGAAFSTTGNNSRIFAAGKQGNLSLGFSATEVSLDPSINPYILEANGRVRMENLTEAAETNGKILVLQNSDGKFEIMRSKKTLSDLVSFSFGDVKHGFQPVDHSGWIKLDGRSLSALTTSQRAVAISLFGNITILPNAEGKVLKQKGEINTIGGSDTVTLNVSNLPSYSLTGNVNVPPHSHTYSDQHPKHTQKFCPDKKGVEAAIAPGINETKTTAEAEGTTANVSINSGGQGLALSVEDAYLSVNTFVYLGD